MGYMFLHSKNVYLHTLKPVQPILKQKKMKKIYTIAAVLAVAVAANAQRASVVSPVVLQPVNLNTPAQQTLMMPPTDTLVADAAFTAPVLYNSSNGGYVVGVNGYGDLQKAQIFRPGAGAVVYGAIYWFGAKSVGANGNVAMRVYQLDGTGTSTASNADICPNSTYVSDNVALANVDTSLDFANAYVHTFSTAPYCAGDFAVGFSVAGCGAGDSIGCVSTTDPDSNTEDCWEEWSDNTWHTMLEPNNWGLNIALYIFPIVELNTGVNETPFVNGVKLGVSGNPFTTNTVVNYSLQNSASKVTITIVDAQGRVVSTETTNNVAAGAYNFNFDGANLANGTYFVQIAADNARLATRIVKQ
jgi:FlgD Ig-like domain